MLRDAVEPDLARVQRTLLAEIRGVPQRKRGGASERDGVSSGAASWVAAPCLESAREQIGVYRRMHTLRLAREVAREYPATHALLGAERFDRVAHAFAARRGSRSFTLEGYAADLPAFLSRSRALPGPMRAAAAALARYERARARTLRAPSAMPCARADCLLRADGTRLLAFAFDVETAWRRFARGETPGRLRRRRTQIALFRRTGVVAALRVAPCEAPLLRALLRGESLQTAVDSAIAAGLRPAAIRAALEGWVGAGLLAAQP
jgi:hypothetical protein